MTIVLACALLLLTAAVVVLFAMMGELATRTAAAPAAAPAGVSPLEEYRLGAVVDEWPESLAVLGTGSRSVVLVLSTICASCAKVAGQLSEGALAGVKGSVGIAISCAEQADGDEFVLRHGLTDLPHHVDVRGAWVAGSFSVTQSPTALVFDDGVLTGGHLFTSVEELLREVGLTGGARAVV
ncbi:hypothetical protein [Streptomyces beijiangensis]|uniref:Thioredoxin domain-containing protein n=1 Tax=Streptomyces beijiangensis TaxID=163361 RepID=A0A939F782_9ACTN|nr:hypothetical protein [Streptomyces beijiangensis]MBO0512247.1 hypothetical protein [Streptomyces beijiangensis]